MKHGKVALEVRDGVGVVTLDDPGTLNAWDMKLLEDFTEAVDQLEDRSSGIRCALLTGAGRAFSSGANLKGFGTSAKGSKSGADSVLATHINPLFLRLRELRVPLVTAVNGVAAGIGMSFALAGDLVLMARSAYFLQAFARIGLVPDGGSSYVLPRLIGTRRALELAMLADRLPAETALEWGLVNRVVDDAKLMDEALNVAERLAKGPASLGLIRRMFWDSLENDHAGQLALEAKLQGQAGRTKDAKEGVAAFLEKRDPVFRGE